MKIAVFGPTGGTGRLLVAKAIAADHSVTALTRSASAFAQQPDVRTLTGSVLDPRAVDQALAGQDAVLSALGGRPWRTAPVCGPAIRNITAAMHKHGLRRIVAISTLGAGDTRGDVGWFARNFFFGFVLRNEVADKEAMEGGHGPRLDGGSCRYPERRSCPRQFPRGRRSHHHRNGKDRTRRRRGLHAGSTAERHVAAAQAGHR